MMIIKKTKERPRYLEKKKKKVPRGVKNNRHNRVSMNKVLILIVK